MIATVALPVFNNKNIALLAMEGLIRQQTDFKWELIVCEENNGKHNGVEFFEGYFERLKDVGCLRLIYIPVTKGKLYLSHKWKLMAQHAQGDVFLMQGSDDYPDPRRVQTACEAIRDGYQWFQVPRFYCYWSGNGVYEYNDYRNNINLGIDKGTRTEYVKNANNREVKKGVDFWMFSNARAHVPDIKIKSTIYDDYKGVSTTGFNTISDQRELMLFAEYYPYTKVNKTLYDILPSEVVEKIKDYESKKNQSN